jgi:hypothetical protein
VIFEENREKSILLQKPELGESLQILMKQALEFLKNFFKALIFAFGTRLRHGWFFVPARLRRGSRKKNGKKML